MDRKGYRQCLNYELFRGKKYSFFQRIRIKYFQPNTNCIFLARKMWWLYSRGPINRFRSKMIYLKIWRKYGCCIYPSAIVKEGFMIAHPVGIVIGNCNIGTNFTILQNCSIGINKDSDNSLKTYPRIGNNVTMMANSSIFGGVSVGDNVIIGANSLVLNNLESGCLYFGQPAKKIRIINPREEM